MNTLTLKPGKEKSLLRRHPWIYLNAIDRVDGRPASGATIIVRAHDGRFLARASFSPTSAIRARVWTFDENEPVDHAFFKRRVQRALEHRNAMVSGTGAVRLIFGEADGLPGLIVDHYRAADGAREQLVCQFMGAGVEAWKQAIVAALVGATGCPHVYERSDVTIREKEGLEQTTGVLAGDEPPETLIVDEGGVRYHVDVRRGHKTGFYIDQRDNRALIARHAAGKDVLNCFCYTGGFSLAALKGGAKRVVSIDS
jgi:23S rRNA (cytosine1962-C5)-methyltransferase